MPAFTYRIAQSDGRVTAQKIDAESAIALRRRLEAEGHLVLSVAQSGASLVLFEKKTISTRDFLAFNQKFAVLLRAGLPIIKILDILIEGSHQPVLAQALRGVQQGIREGHGIAEALSRYPKIFPEIYAASIAAGEKSGNLIEVIRRFMAYQRRVIDVRKKVVAALAYPSFLIVFASLVLLFLILYIMPKFSGIYAEAGAALPGLTRILLDFVDSLREYRVAWFAGVVTVSLALGWGYRSREGRALLDRTIMRFPIVGPIVQRHYLIRITRTLSTVLKSGIPLVSSLRILLDSLESPSLRARMSVVVDAVSAGGKLAQALATTALFPRISIEMIGVGEQTAALEDMLNDVAEFHEEELDLYLARVTTWIEPVLLLGVGALIAIILMAMYLPIFNLAGVVQ